MPLSAFAQTDRAPDEYFIGDVQSIGEVDAEDPYLLEQLRDVEVELRDSGDVITAQYGDDPTTDADDLRVGESVVVLLTEVFVGEQSYIITDKYRIPSILWLLGLFFVVAVAFAGKRGVTAIAGLAVSVFILLWYTVPSIVDGSSPFLVATISAFIIAIVSLTIAHGWSKQTGLALVSTLVTLLISLGLSELFVRWAKLFGTGSEEAFHLTFAGLGDIDLRGLLLAGIIIGVLGVLDDVTTTQTATVKSLSEAGVKGLKELFSSASSVGREHVVSLINTLALVYVGASLPLLLMFSVNEGTVPYWILLNSEMITEEIVRTLIGSTALVLAVPISTIVAAWYYNRSKS